MIHPNGWFGDWHVWIMLVGVWLGLGSLFTLTLGLIARVGAWKGRGK